MIPDIRPPYGSWMNVYTATGITAGTRLLIQNKSAGRVAVWEGATPPISDGQDDRHGFSLLPDGRPIKTTAGSPGVWVLYWETGYSDWGRLCVQVYAP